MFVSLHGRTTFRGSGIYARISLRRSSTFFRIRQTDFVLPWMQFFPLDRLVTSVIVATSHPASTYASGRRSVNCPNVPWSRELELSSSADLRKERATNRRNWRNTRKAIVYFRAVPASRRTKLLARLSFSRTRLEDRVRDSFRLASSRSVKITSKKVTVPRRS